VKSFTDFGVLAARCLFIYLFKSRDKSKASSRRDMCLNATHTKENERKIVTPVPCTLRKCAVRKSSGAGEPPTKRKEKEKSTSKERLETLAVTPGLSRTRRLTRRLASPKP